MSFKRKKSKEAPLTKDTADCEVVSVEFTDTDTDVDADTEAGDEISNVDSPISTASRTKPYFYFIIALVLIIIATICAVFFIKKPSRTTPGKQPQLTLQESIEQLKPLYESDIIDSMSSMKTNSDVASYLLNWAKNKGVSASALDNDAVIFNMPTSEGIAQSLTGTTIICPYDIEAMYNSIDSLVASLAIARSATSHADMRIIFIPSKLGRDESTRLLNEENIRFNNRVLIFENSTYPRLSTVTGGYEKTGISREIQFAAPIFTKAYRISISGFPSASIGDENAAQPNPIMILGSKLANLKSTAHLFELADFQGGTDSSTTVGSASAIITVSDEEELYFRDYFEAFAEEFADEFSEKYPDATLEYSLSETLPEQVYSGKDLDSIISFLYTASSGISERDKDGNILGASNIGWVYTQDNIFNVEISSYACVASTLNSLRESYVTVAGLVGLSYKQLYSSPIFNGGSVSLEFRNELIAACKKYDKKYEYNPKDSFRYTLSDIISSQVSGVPILYVGVTGENVEMLAGGIVTLTEINVSQ